MLHSYEFLFITQFKIIIAVQNMKHKGQNFKAYKAKDFIVLALYKYFPQELNSVTFSLLSTWINFNINTFFLYNSFVKFSLR